MLGFGLIRQWFETLYLLCQAGHSRDIAKLDGFKVTPRDCFQQPGELKQLQVISESLSYGIIPLSHLFGVIGIEFAPSNLWVIKAIRQRTPLERFLFTPKLYTSAHTFLLFKIV